ncbi:hypothetical protein [Catellatospora sp. NPDC049609]|uniref:hypothetical protein n=1 Tax=Catellatospora sp. NPDC049609 TaxID=3155505 RepID=UPI003431256E
MGSDLHREIAEDTLAWFSRVCTCDRDCSWHAKAAFLSATFACYTSPADASWWELMVCSKYLILFSSLDDEAMEDRVELLARFQGGSRAFGGHLGSIYHPFLGELRARGLTTSSALLGRWSAFAADGSDLSSAGGAGAGPGGEE